MADDDPQYTLYRARPRFLSRGDGGLREMQQGRPDGYEKPKRRRRISVWRVVRWVAALVVAWLVA